MCNKSFAESCINNPCWRYGEHISHLHKQGKPILDPQFQFGNATNGKIKDEPSLLREMAKYVPNEVDMRVDGRSKSEIAGSM